MSYSGNSMADMFDELREASFEQEHEVEMKAQRLRNAGYKQCGLCGEVLELEDFMDDMEYEDCLECRKL